MAHIYYYAIGDKVICSKEQAEALREAEDGNSYKYACFSPSADPHVVE